MRKQQNIFLIGPMGAGKSTMGRALAKALQRPFYDTDHAVEEKTGVTVAWIFDVEGEEGFRRREEETVEELTQRSGIVLATGAGVIASPKNRQALSARGVVIYLQVSVEAQLERMRQDSQRPLIQTPDREAVLRELQKTRASLYEQIADYTFDTMSYTINSLTREIISTLEGTGP